MTLVLLRCEVLVHDKMHRRGSWAEHASKEWYISTLIEHYRYHIVVVKDTKQERMSDTAFFRHKCITQPKVTTYNIIMVVMNDLAVAVQEK